MTTTITLLGEEILRLNKANKKYENTYMNIFENAVEKTHTTTNKVAIKEGENIAAGVAEKQIITGIAAYLLTFYETEAPTIAIEILHKTQTEIEKTRGRK